MRSEERVQLFNVDLLYDTASRLHVCLTHICQAGVRVDAIVGRSISGIVPASVLAWMADLPLVVVRDHRTDENRHGVEYGEGFDTYVVVDGCASRGIEDIVTLLGERRCAGVILYGRYAPPHIERHGGQDVPVVGVGPVMDS